MNEYSNIRSTESDYQIWLSSVERLPGMGGVVGWRAERANLTWQKAFCCSLCVIHKFRRCFVPYISTDSWAKRVYVVSGHFYDVIKYHQFKRIKLSFEYMATERIFDYSVIRSTPTSDHSREVCSHEPFNILGLQRILRTCQGTAVAL